LNIIHHHSVRTQKERLAQFFAIKLVQNYQNNNNIMGSPPLELRSRRRLQQLGRSLPRCVIILLVWISCIAPSVSALLPPFSASTTTTTTTQTQEDFAPRRYYDPDLVRYRCRVAYDGTGFCGFQIQQRPSSSSDADNKNKKKKGYNNKHQRTVQSELERVLSQRFNRLVRVVGAGRTDAGVHARGQAAHFDLFRHNETTTIMAAAEDDGEALLLLQTSMNRMLPADMRVWNVQAAPDPCLEVPVSKKKTIPDGQGSKKDDSGSGVDDTTTTTSSGIYAWNVMQKPTGKLYSYRICLGDSMDPIQRHSRWQIDRPHDINPTMLERILKRYEGTNDFVCFAGALEQNARKTGRVIGTVRTVNSIDLVEDGEEGEGLYRIDIRLDGALYKMVRNLVGTALDVCRGRLTEEQFQELLQPVDGAGRKSNPCKPAPPQGLTLERVYYEDNDVF
jgi:tRNA pseudouridine38-40 synthase